MTAVDTNLHAPVEAPGFVGRLSRRYARLNGAELLQALILNDFKNEIAMVSSFGADSAVLLHMVAKIAPETPVFFLDTGKHFPETLSYRQKLVEAVGLTNVRDIVPDEAEIAAEDEHGHLHALDNNKCCDLRKVRPLEKALSGFEARISGRKRFQSKGRRSLNTIDWSRDHVAINPLAGWTATDIKAYILEHDLPRHPLVAQGFASIGCGPCTTAVAAGEDARAGRWRQTDKTECGIHLNHNGEFVRTIPAGC